MGAIVDKADTFEPRINQAFVEYAQARGFVIDPARVRTPTTRRCLHTAPPGSFLMVFCFCRFLVPAGRPVGLRGVMVGIW